LELLNGKLEEGMRVQEFLAEYGKAFRATVNAHRNLFRFSLPRGSLFRFSPPRGTCLGFLCPEKPCLGSLAQRKLVQVLLARKLSLHPPLSRQKARPIQLSYLTSSDVR